MGVEVQGFDDLRNDMLSMAIALDYGESVTHALKMAAVPVAEQMKRNAATDPKIVSGDLRGAIRVGPVKYRSRGGKSITIGIHRKDWSHDEYYPAYVEYGHGGPAPAPAHPFARVTPVSSDNRRTYNNDNRTTFSFAGANFNVRSDQDVHDLAMELATLTRQNQRGKGG